MTPEHFANCMKCRTFAVSNPKDAADGRPATARAHYLTHRVNRVIMFNYFPHSSAMRTADVVLTLRMAEGPAGYGVYCMLLELLRDAEDRKLVVNPRNLAFALNVPDVELVDRVIHSPGLFSLSEDGFFTSPWLEVVMSEFDAKKEAAREAGRRGAAVRYSQKPPHSNPIAPPMPTPSQGNSNTPIQEEKKNENNPSTQTRSKLLDLKWGGYEGEFFFDLARRAHTEISPIDYETIKNLSEQYEARGVRDKNPGVVLDLCVAMRLSSEMLSFLLKLTGGGMVGTRVMKELIRILWAWNGTGGVEKFRPKYPADYVLTQLVPLA